MNNGSEQHAIRRTNGPSANGHPVDAYMDVPLSGRNGQAAHHVAGTSLSEFRRLKQMMRGRWTATIVLAILLAAAGGFLGFRSGHKLYVSTAQIRVVPIVPKVLYSVDDKGMPPMFDSFVEQQVALLESRRVAALAMQDPLWQSVPAIPGRPKPGLSAIEVTRVTDLLTITATDIDPDVAVTSIRTIVPAFQKLYEENDAQSNEKRLLVLQNIQTVKGNELAANREEISNLAKPYGTDDLHDLFSMKQTRVQKLENSIADTEADLTAAIRNRAGTRGPDKVSPEQWASVSSDMFSLVQDRNQTRRNITRLRAESVLENNPQMIEQETLLKTQENSIAEMSGKLQSEWQAGLISPPTAGPATGDPHAVGNPDSLREEIADLKARRDDAKKEMIAIGDDQLRISDLKYKADSAVHVRDAAQQQIDQLNTEATINGRLMLVTPGDRPVGASKDTRITFAAAGIGGGGLLGFAIVLAFAALDGRLRSPDETGGTAPAINLLGLLPRLPADLADAAQADRAAHCVTGVRNLLQLWSRSNDRRCFVVTSPVAGAGKTSLAFALGVSYAARSRVLLIDCDLVGAGLTAQVDKVVNRKLGDLLIRGHFLTSGQLGEALEQAKQSSRRLGEVVVERGFAKQSDVDQLLETQRSAHLGILDTLEGNPLSDCVAATGIPGLSILPVGAATARDVSLLSGDALDRLVDAAKQAYDIVLIDTGPVPGSLEAQLAASVADGVIVVLSPGIKRPMVRRCIGRLDEIGATIAGLVYNRATDNDVFIYGSDSMQRRSQPALPAPPAPADSPAIRNPKMGPLASAVSQAAPNRHPAGPSDRSE